MGSPGLELFIDRKWAMR